MRAQAGDLEALGHLYDRHQESIYRYLWSRLHDEPLAEDLTGDVFARMLRALPSYRPGRAPFRAWLYRIAHNLLVDHHRSQDGPELVPLPEVEPTLGGDGGDPMVIVQERLSIERIKHALARIDPVQQDVVVMRFLVGLSLKEVAAALGRSVSAIKSLQHRGLVALRAALEEA